MRRTVIIRKTADAGGVSVRCGDTVLGTVTGLSGGSSEVMSGSFSHRPAFADLAPLLADLDQALTSGADAQARAGKLRTEIEHRGVIVWHGVHEMRIDVPETLEIARGTVRFRATSAFLAMRTGGLG